MNIWPYFLIQTYTCTIYMHTRMHVYIHVVNVSILFTSNLEHVRSTYVSILRTYTAHTHAYMCMQVQSQLAVCKTISFERTNELQENEFSIHVKKGICFCTSGFIGKICYTCIKKISSQKKNSVLVIRKSVVECSVHKCCNIW